MDGLEIIILSQKNNHHMISLICGLENTTNEFIYETEKDSHREQAGGWPNRRGEGG